MISVNVSRNYALLLDVFCVVQLYAHLFCNAVKIAERFGFRSILYDSVFVLL